MTGPPPRPGDRPPSSPGRREGPSPRTTTQTPAHGAAKPLSPALDTTFKVGLVLKDRLRAYPWLIGLLLAFIAYELYLISALRFSIGLTLLTVFDAFLVWLTWREYRSKRAQQRARAAVAAPSPGGHRAARPQSGRRT